MQMTSAAEVNRSTFWQDITMPGILSQITVAWQPCCSATLAVRRAPCRKGRVSGQMRRTCLPMAAASRSSSPTTVSAKHWVITVASPGSSQARAWAHLSMFR